MKTRLALGAIALLLVSVVAYAANRDYPPPLRIRGHSSNALTAPFFAFAPTGGAGMPATPCTGAVPTGSNGEPLTFTRTGGASCLKSTSQTAGIQPGDMVTVTTGQPRVVFGANGLLGLQQESAGDNTTWWSEGFDHAALWSKVGTGAAAPTVTADQAQGPDGGVIADRIQAAATSAAQVSTVEELGGCLTSTTVAASVFVRGTSGSGITDLCVRTAASTYTCTPCSFVATSITRCELPGVTTSTAGDIIIGNASLYNGGTVRSAADFSAVGAQCEASQGDVTSYMPAPGSADGTRGLEVADFPAALSGLVGFSMSASFVADSPAYHAGGTAVPMVLGDGTLGDTTAPSTYVWLYSAVTSGRAAVDTSGVAASGASSMDLFFASFDAGTPINTTVFHTGSFLGECQEGLCAAVQGNPGIASTLGTPVFTRLILGRQSGAASNGFNGIINQVCLDRTSSRCQPAQPTGPTVWLGDSIIYGTGSIPQTPAVQLSRLAGHTIVGAGVGGNTTSQCASRWDSTYRGKYAKVIWSCAINDIAGGATGATTAANAIAVFNEVRADGATLIATGVMPWDGSTGWTSGKDTEGLAYNSAIQADIVAHGGTYVTTASLGSGSPLTLLSQYDSGDHIHPTVAGAGALATLVQAAGP